MSTQKETVEFILEKLGDKRFSVRAMFGEYALYADPSKSSSRAGGRVVGLICDDQLYVKILPESAELEDVGPGSRFWRRPQGMETYRQNSLPGVKR